MTLIRANLDVPDDESLIALVQISMKPDGTLQGRVLHLDLTLEAKVDVSRVSNLLRWLADATDIAGIQTTESE